ncbi:hypothetical protein BFJ63_vAg10271 [Fusarium oxysporum f. sp. narcissi]|uniref:Uncharacterized protein n=2 Tax=Fusarium oxysporum TaxID=5507 RepID=A0A420RYD2_FUSOX|nr:hypothetical protein FOXYS1_8416 [Fusarium oxysporum]RKL22015.1 hypothetical protein BFJ70_g13408 [Fusarium oxysporum]RYC86877.1 hypothetical protein BFJ63_vAg10271 [Fusarium oxysporum f. sp. narcissi]
MRLVLSLGLALPPDTPTKSATLLVRSIFAFEMRLDLILLVGFAGPSAAVPHLKSHISFRRSWASASTRLDSVLAELHTIYPGKGTVPPGAVASTTGTFVVPGACSCDNEAPATSAASAGVVTSGSISTPPAVVTATSTLTTSATPSPGEVESGSASVSAASSAVNPRATTTTTTITTTRPASTAAADPAFTTKGSHHHQADTSDGGAHRSEHDLDSLDRELSTTKKSKLLRRHKGGKHKDLLLIDKEREVRYLKRQSERLWKAAHSWEKVLQQNITDVRRATNKLRRGQKQTGRYQAQKDLEEKKLVLQRVKSVSDRAHRYARIQEKWLRDAEKELEKARWEKAAREVQGLSHEEILRKEDFGKHASSHNPRKRSEPKDAREHNKQKQEKEDKTAKHKDEKNHDKEEKKTDVAKEEATEKSDHEKYEDVLYRKIGQQIEEKLGDKSKGHHSPIEKGEKPVYVITQQYKVYKCDDKKGCKEDFGSEEEVKEVEGKQQAKDEDEDAEKKEGKENKVEKEEEKDLYDEEGDPPLLADGDEAGQLQRLQQLYMQWRGMLVEPIRKDLDPILKNDQFPEDTEMAAQHQEGNEKEQRKRLSHIYMSYRSMLIEKFTKLLDPILHDKNQKTD